MPSVPQNEINNRSLDLQLRLLLSDPNPNPNPNPKANSNPRYWMHPFCCSSPVPVSPTTNGPSLMPIPLHLPPPSKPAPATSSSPDPASTSTNGLRSAPATTNVRLNDIVGNGISGILQKWVNYGKGWRRRWFVLQDGVLSYYKIHGPDKIEVSLETEKGTKVIGEESMRRLSRHRNAHSNSRPKPFGEVHLKVSTIRESRSDDKRFSIFTGTKRLHLRAETREDRLMWMEALRAVKEMFPRISNSELMAPVDNFVVSTEKLRRRLVEEGVKEEVIQESEQIVRSEFAALQNQLALLKQKQALLMDTLRQLEV